MTHVHQGGLPGHSRSNYSLLRVPLGGKIRLRCLTDTWADVDTHWNGKGTDLCPRTEECMACRSGCRKIWKGYIVGESTTSRQVRLVELTALASFQLEEIPWPKQSLLGAIVCLSRTGPLKNSPVEATIEGWEETCQKHSMETLEHCVLTIYRQHISQLIQKIGLPRQAG